MHEHAPAGADAPAPAHEVRTRRGEAVGAVDEEHVDRSRDLGQRCGGEGAHVAHAVAHAGAREVGPERLEVGAPRSASAPISCARGPSRHADRRTRRRRRARQDDRRAPAERADLHDADDVPTRPAEAAARYRRHACASVSHPSTSRAAAQASLEGHDAAAARRRRRRAVSPRARTEEGGHALHAEDDGREGGDALQAGGEQNSSAMATTAEHPQERVCARAIMYFTVRSPTASGVIAHSRAAAARRAA